MQRISSIGMMIVSCTLMACSALGMQQPLAGEPVALSGPVDAVTVYRGQALITRVVELDGRAGIHEFVITDLPTRIVRGSLHAEGMSGVTVRSVRYREHPVRADVGEEMEALQAQIDQAKDELTRINRRMGILTKQETYLAKLEEFTAGSATGDLNRGVLDAKSLRELSDYIFQSQEKIAEQSLELQFAKKAVEEEISHLTREQQALGQRATRTSREAVVIVEIPAQAADEPPAIKLHYLVDSANWTPSYTVRGDLETGDVLVEYHASIEQRSGENWDNVRMTLSTATPSLVARAPELTALAVALQPASSQAGAPRPSREELRHSQVIVDRGRRQMAPSAGQALAEADMMLNAYANQLQLLEFAGNNAPAALVSAASDEGHSVVYQIPDRTSLPSRPERQHIQIAAMPMAGEFYKLAVPVLTSYVYAESRVTNTSDHVLLAGPVATYAGGQFVGHSELDDLSVGEPARLGFGIDSMLRSDRQLVKQDTRIQGGNRVVDSTYRLTMHNFGTEETIVRLMDRLPKVKPEEIRLVVLEDGATSSNVIAHEYDEDAGILRWDVLVPARESNPGTVIVEYAIRLEYDRQMILAGGEN